MTQSELQQTSVGHWQVRVLRHSLGLPLSLLQDLLQSLFVGLLVAAGTVLCLSMVSPALAQGFPTKALRIVVPNAAGGAADLTARVVGQKLSESLGQPVVIDNKPGAGGVVAGESVARAAPDGHTLLLISSGTAVSAALFKSLPYDMLRDFSPVAVLANFDLVIVGAEGGRFKTLGELVAYAQAHPGQLNIGTPNIGTTQHLAAELFKHAAGLDLQIVPFNGSPAVVNALRGGQIDAGLDIVSPLLAQIRAARLRALAVTGAQRSRVLPEVPTVREAGISGYNVSSWNGLAAPAGTPPEVLARLSREINAALKDPLVKKKLQDLTLEPLGGTPELAASLLDRDIKRWREVITRAGIAAPNSP